MAVYSDNSYIGPYLHDWLKYCRESTKAEQQVIEKAEEFCVPYAGAQPEMIETLFKVSSRYNIEPHAKHLSVHLLDRYVANRFFELIKDCGELTSSTVHKVRESLLSGLKVDLFTCLMIASKVDLFKTGLMVPQIQDMLHSVDRSRHYTKASIIVSEMRILRTLDFRLPLCLPINVVELFLAYTELSEMPKVRDICFQLLDIAYLRHENLFGQLHLLARGKKFDKSCKNSRDFLGLEANSLFIAAAVVVCSCFFFRLKKNLVETLTSRLENLVQMNAIDISIMANILFTFAIDEEDFKKL